jgi:hypothetical protein
LSDIPPKHNDSVRLPNIAFIDTQSGPLWMCTSVLGPAVYL